MISLRSQVARKVLGFFILNPQDSLYVNELSRKLTLDKRNLVKKLRELEREGILRSEKRGNLKFYGVNSGFPLYQEYRRIILKTVGVEERLREIMRETPGIKEAYIYGSYAQDTMSAHSDLDLLVVGDHEIKTLQRKINLLQREIGREINAVNISESDFKKRVDMKDPFIAGVLRRKTIRLV
jgi:predicted nucleotidyltransferase